MENKNEFKCVNCGEKAVALYRTYGPSVLKLTKCEKCKGAVDKYIEYDPVIVIIDLVLISKEAQRHIIYNTNFKKDFLASFSLVTPLGLFMPIMVTKYHQSYWKLIIILIMLETYGVWRNDSLFNIAVNTVCDIQTNNTLNTTHLNLSYKFDLPEPWRSDCQGWAQDREVADLFIWEKDFYIQFMSIFAGTVIFVSTIHILMRLMKTFAAQNEVSLTRLLKGFALAYVSSLFTLPTLVWGTAEAPDTRALHYLLVFLYSFVVFYNAFTVLYECPKVLTLVVLSASHCIKYQATFHATPLIRRLLYP